MNQEILFNEIINKINKEDLDWIINSTNELLEFYSKEKLGIKEKYKLILNYLVKNNIKFDFLEIMNVINKLLMLNVLNENDKAFYKEILEVAVNEDNSNLFETIFNIWILDKKTDKKYLKKIFMISEKHIMGNVFYLLLDSNFLDKTDKPFYKEIINDIIMEHKNYDYSNVPDDLYTSFEGEFHQKIWYLIDLDILDKSDKEFYVKILERSKININDYNSPKLRNSLLDKDILEKKEIREYYIFYLDHLLKFNYLNQDNALSLLEKLLKKDVLWKEEKEKYCKLYLKSFMWLGYTKLVNYILDLEILNKEKLFI